MYAATYRKKVYAVIGVGIGVAVWAVDHYWWRERRTGKKFNELTNKLVNFDEKLVRKENEQIEREKEGMKQ